MTKNLKEFTAKKSLYFLIKNCNLLIPRPPLRTLKLQKKSSSLKREHLALKNLNFLHFCGSTWIRIRIPIADPDPRIQPTKMNAHPCGSGSATMVPGFYKCINSDKYKRWLISYLVLCVLLYIY